eukprot:TRINITY_DN1306_c0_g1_i1.p1 TRINITY_DN1306_c0_g1~~TRINITY_DN1306_c0_g1_i1.p1  ORF type:complete len:298 (-),score=54.18 TRINITY_DN1306_c0_g1_i1:104-934(-)
MSSFTRNNNGTRSSSHRRPSYKNMATLERLIHLHRQEVDPENAAKIEKRVKNFIRSLDHHSAAQLSRTQLIKGHEKTVVWLKNSKDLAEPAVMTEDLLNQDIDPAKFLSPNFKNVPPSANAKKYASVSLTLLERDVLTGQKFKDKIIPHLNVDESNMGMPLINIQEWLKKYPYSLVERDHLRRWMRQWEDEDVTQEELIKMWQKKRREHTYDEWLLIHELKNPAEMSLNEMLAQFRRDVPHSPMLPESTTAPRYGVSRDTNRAIHMGAFMFASRRQ